MFDNKIVLVTGASSGIGRSVAMSLLQRGAVVIGTSRDKNRLKSLKIQYPERFYALNLDLTDPSACDSMVTRLPNHLQEIDILINNAGSDIGGRVNFGDGVSENWINTIETNVNGVLRVTYAVLQGMKARDRGDILNLGSTSGLEPVATTAAYSASKHAINGFSESLRKELEPTGIRVMQVLPGIVRTEFGTNRFNNRDKADAFYNTVGKWLTADDIADSVIYCLGQPQHVVVSQLVVVPKCKAPDTGE